MQLLIVSRIRNSPETQKNLHRQQKKIIFKRQQFSRTARGIAADPAPVLHRFGGAHSFTAHPAHQGQFFPETCKTLQHRHTAPEKFITYKLQLRQHETEITAAGPPDFHSAVIHPDQYKAASFLKSCICI